MNFKALIEKRNEIVEQVNAMFAAAEKETRAFNDEEKTKYEELTQQIKDIDATLKMHDEARSFDKIGGEYPAPKADFKAECRSFAQFVRENRASDVNWTTGSNGAVIPSTIANKIIETVENICPIYAKATKYHVNGTLSFPVYDESAQKHTMAYASEFTTLTATSGKFKSVSLGGYLAGTLTKISKSLINNVNFDITSYVITKIAQAISRFIEHELLLGTGSNAMTGILVGATDIVRAASATAIATDDLVTLQAQIPQVNQANCTWIMNTNTMLALRKLKDNEGHYYLQPDLTAGFGYTLLGKQIFLSDNMPAIATGNKAIVYGDMSAMYANIHENIEMQIMMEKFADEHAVGVVAWLEMDSNLVEPQKVAVLKMA